MSKLDLLKTELTDDPLARGYSGMTEQAAADNLNTENRSRAIDVVTPSQLHKELDATEFAALAQADKDDLLTMLSLSDGQIIVSDPSFARTRLLAMFAGGSTTRSNLIAAFASDISRGEEIGFGLVRPGDVEEARR